MKRIIKCTSTDDMLDAFKSKLDLMNSDACTDIEASVNRLYDEDGDVEDSNWEEIDHKMIHDFDGFLTDYTLYHNVITDEYACVSGDKDIYRPEYGEFDTEFDNYDEAIDWFNNYSVEEF